MHCAAAQGEGRKPACYSNQLAFDLEDRVDEIGCWSLAMRTMRTLGAGMMACASRMRGSKPSAGLGNYSTADTEFHHHTHRTGTRLPVSTQSFQLHLRVWSRSNPFTRPHTTSLKVEVFEGQSIESLIQRCHKIKLPVQACTNKSHDNAP